MNILGVLTAAGLLALAIAYAITTNTWPQLDCHGVKPYGNNDYNCTYTIGR